jgi:hypothetical protein
LFTSGWSRRVQALWRASGNACRWYWDDEGRDRGRARPPPFDGGPCNGLMSAHLPAATVNEVSGRMEPCVRS